MAEARRRRQVAWCRSAAPVWVAMQFASAAYVAAQGTKLHCCGRVCVEQSDGEIRVGGGTVVDVTGHVAL
ncbi:hypothetical protein P3102_16950 [Amycolatopsis sp. QT-25]|uniref:hypothetical protein n=1 Tax=Amycolatopsis sp. QT-25 TaxID=3034022 RepID=UPI0023EAA598|nr:hypothetical protein [Amycolatopsis sp. QT-25]WET82774.1 hypothetical protein P3102_16950 [Amycolatopsis sp. QT-25]